MLGQSARGGLLNSDAELLVLGRLELYVGGA